MSVRKRLNGMYLGACAVPAAFVGAVFASWWVFGVTLVLAAGAQVMAGNIRPAGGRQRY